MSKDVDRHLVLKSIKVMKTVKKDGSWIHMSNQGKKEQQEARMDIAKDPSPVKEKSYVLSAIKIFENQVPAEKLRKAKPEIAIANTAEENNGGYANTSKSNVKEGSVDIHVEDQVQNSDAESVSLSKGNPDLVPPLELVEQMTAKEENNEENPDTKTEESNVDHTAAKVSTIPDIMVSTGSSLSQTDSHTVSEDVLKSLPEIPAANEAALGDEASLQGALEPNPVTELKSPPQSAEKATVMSEESTVETTDDTKNISPLVISAIMQLNDMESEDESAAPTEEVLKIRSEEASVYKVHLVNNTTTDQYVESVPKNAEDLMRELNINDALEPVSDSETNAVQLSDRTIKLTDLLDVEPTTADAVLEPVEDLQLSQSEQAAMNNSDDAQTVVRAVCSLCDRIISGNTKIIFSEPAVIYHPECLKCGVCAKALGDLLTRLFLHHQVIHCDDCFANALMA